MAFYTTHVLSNIVCLFFWACATAPVTSVGSTSVNMTTSLGDVTGFVTSGDVGEHDVNVFYGIPFAKPPVGQLRFKPPEKAVRWSGSKDATKQPNSCWQTLDEAFGNFKGSQMWNSPTTRSEDCLYLNAWLPVTLTKSPKAIMVWIFGGGLWSGSISLDVYNAVKLAARHDVIVVSITYRLGPFGFMFSGTDEAPGNVGMLDQVMAMEWVKENAINMGGDPNKITIFGESAGGASVGYHLLSPLTKDLFANAIMMSSSPLVKWGVQTHKTALTRFKSLAKEVGCGSGTPEAMVRCMRNAKASDLSVKQWNVLTEGTYFDAPFVLVAKDSYLPDHPEVLVQKGMINKANVIAGVVKNEGIYWLLYGFPSVFGRRENNPVNRSQFLEVEDEVIRQNLLMYKEKPGYSQARSNNVYDNDKEDDDGDDESFVRPFLRDLTTVEYHDGVEPLNRMNYLNTLDAISGDILFKCSIRDYARQHALRAKGGVYVYSFEHRVSSMPWPAWLGVAHGYEIEVFMGRPFLHQDSYTDEERTLSDRTMRYFTNFAKSGDPNKVSQSGASIDQWPVFVPNTEHYHIFNLKDSNSAGLRFSQCKYWETILPAVHRIPNNDAGPIDVVLGSQCPDSAALLNPVTCTQLLALLIATIGVLVWNLRH